MINKYDKYLCNHSWKIQQSLKDFEYIININPHTHYIKIHIKYVHIPDLYLILVSPISVQLKHWIKIDSVYPFAYNGNSFLILKFINFMLYTLYIKFNKLNGPFWITISQASLFNKWND